jgi:hypothetical protein
MHWMLKVWLTAVLTPVTSVRLLQVLPKNKQTYSTPTKPTKPGAHAAADELVSEGKKIMVFRENLTIHTATRLES